MKAKRTILCVDDNDHSLSLRKLVLETRGYRVIACLSAGQALEEFKKGGVDLVLSHSFLPGTNGCELVRQIKEISPQMPAILFANQTKTCAPEVQADLFSAQR